MAPAINATINWADKNHMNLNAEKTEIINILMNHRHTYDKPVALNDDIHIALSVLVKFFRSSY